MTPSGDMSAALLEALSGSAVGAENGEQTGEFSEFMDEPRPPAEYKLQDIQTSVPDLNSSDMKADYVHARNNTYTLLDMTTKAVADALSVASDTQHPRAFESFNSLVSTARLLTQDLLAMQKVFKDVTRGRPEVEQTTTNVQVNGDVNVQQNKGTTQDLLSIINAAIADGSITPIDTAVDVTPKG